MSRSGVSIRLLGGDDLAVLEGAGTDVFDARVDVELCREFLADPRHHIAVAIDDARIVGFVSGVHFLHPDKPPELFVNELGVAGAYQRRGIAARLLEVMLQHGRALGCSQAWVATETDNRAARALYGSAGGVEDPAPFVSYTFAL
jgi:ribosomal protein S18 acetylase RimI-like enzyme